MAMDPNYILQQLNWRYATKQFDPNRKIPPEHLHILWQAMQLAPSSFGLQPYRFVVVEKPALKQTLRSVSEGQSQVTDASHVCVLTSLRSISRNDIEAYLARIGVVRGIGRESLQPFAEHICGMLLGEPMTFNVHAWTQRQAYIAMGFLLQTAALLHIDACPMEGIDTEAYDNILKVQPFATVAVVALGYRAEQDVYQQFKKVRKAESELFEFV